MSVNVIETDTNWIYFCEDKEQKLISTLINGCPYSLKTKYVRIARIPSIFLC